MKPNNIVQLKSYEYAIGIVNLCNKLIRKKEFILSKQLLRSGTAIGAIIEEAIGGFSKKDFYFKMSIAYKEARESKYWIRLLHDTGYIDTTETSHILGKTEELLKIIGSIRKTQNNNP